MSGEKLIGWFMGTGAAWLIIILLVGGMYGCPQYSVYRERLNGEADLAKAESTRRVAVLEAQAKLDAAGKLADAEIARSKGVAEANRIIGDSLKGNDAYLRYLWIDRLGAEKSEVIYVPTEAGLPILEAGRLHKQEK